MSPQDIPENPNPWLRLVLMIRGWPRGLRQSLLVVVPFTLFLLYILGISLLLVARRWGPIPFQFALTDFLALRLGLLLPLISLVVFQAGLYHLFRTAQKLVFQLHAVDFDAESQIRERIRHRFWGWNGFSLNNYLVIRSTKLEPASHWSTWLGGPTFLIINDGYAAYLERSSCFSRVVGSGFPIAYLEARETIRTIVDLRPQVREADVNAWTNDGIKFKMRVRVEFQIDPDPAQNHGKAKLVYPFNPAAVRKAVEFTAVRLREGKLEESDWRDGAIGSINGLLAHHIYSFHFDELFMNNEGNGQILSTQVMHGLLEQANKHLREAAGVKVISIQIIDIAIPAEIRQQRLNVWGAKKDSMVSRIQGETQAYKIRTNEEARARAQRDLIVAIAKSLGNVDATHFPDEPLLMSLSGILDQGLKDPMVQTYMARGTLDALKRLKDLL
jgi:regulator of protease activity HflC (stomatin/prohibitin superfamily)